MSISYMFLHLHYCGVYVLLKYGSITVQFMYVIEADLQQGMHAKGILINPLWSSYSKLS